MSSPRQAGQKNGRHTIHHACLSGANYIIISSPDTTQQSQMVEHILGFHWGIMQ
jgi:hypothetical protein